VSKICINCINCITMVVVLFIPVKAEFALAIEKEKRLH
jgi:hypothetical protein